MQVYKQNSILLLQGVFTLEAIAKIKPAKGQFVFICEGRPDLEASKSNAKALLKHHIIPTVISDNMAGFLFSKGYVKELVLACQYADKGGALCDTGALIYAVLAKRHKRAVKLAQAKQRSRFLGDPQSICSFEGVRVAPPKTHGYVPLVEWVPGKYLK